MFVAYLFENDFFVLVALNLILGASRFENFLSLLWKCLFGGHRFENSFLALVVLKIVFWHLSILKNFCTCSCEDVSCARGFENDIMSLLALKIFILLFIIVIWKILKKLKIELKNGTLVVSKPLICEDEKKFRLHLVLTVGKDFATKFHLSIPQTLRFNNFNFCGKLNLKCDRKSSNIPSLFLEIPLQAFRIQPCMYGIPELKRFFTSLFTVWKQKE